MACACQDASAKSEGHDSVVKFLRDEVEDANWQLQQRIDLRLPCAPNVNPHWGDLRKVRLPLLS